MAKPEQVVPIDLEALVLAQVGSQPTHIEGIQVDGMSAQEVLAIIQYLRGIGKLQSDGSRVWA